MVFDLKFNTIFCKKVNDIMIIKLREDTVKKASVPRDGASRSERSCKVVAVSCLSSVLDGSGIMLYWAAASAGGEKESRMPPRMDKGRAIFPI